MSLWNSRDSAAWRKDFVKIGVAKPCREYLKPMFKDASGSNPPETREELSLPVCSRLKTKKR